MGPNTTLIFHAMRSTRAIALAIAVLEIGVLTLARARGWDIGKMIVAIGCALFSGSLAADLAAGDAATGRLRTLALLPVRPFDLWISRVLYWLGATVAFSILTCALYTGLGQVYPNGLDDPRASLHWSAMILTSTTSALVAGSVAFAMGALVPHPLGASVLATFAISGIAWGVMSMMNYLNDVDFETSTLSVVLTAVTIGTLSLVVSALAFLSLRVPVAPRWRTLARGGIALVVLTIAAASAGALTIRSHLCDVAPFPEEVLTMEPSPDGSFVALWSRGRSSRQYHSSFVHIVNLSTGDVVPVPDRRVSLAVDWTSNGWTADGMLTLLRAGWSFTQGEKAPIDLVKVDPTTGEIVDRGSGDASKLREFPSGWGTARSFNKRKDDVKGARPIRDVKVSWTASGKTLTFTSRVPFRWSPYAILMTKTPGVFLGCDEAGKLWRFDMSTNDKRLLHDGPVDYLWLSPDDRFVIAQTHDSAEVVNVNTLTRVAGPWTARGYQAMFVRGVESGRFVNISTHGATTRLVDLRSGTERVLPFHSRGTSSIVSIGTDRFLIAREDRSLDIIDITGKTLRRLLPPARP